MANGVQIGALHVSLSADSAAFDKGMDDVAKKSKETAKEVEGDGSSMAEAIEGYAADIAASLAAAFAIGHMAERIKEQIDYADALADVAARSNQSAEALSKFEYALHFQDATLQDYTDGLQKLEQNMAAANEGSKEQAIIFEALNIKLKDQDKMLRNSGDVMMDFANKLAEMANGATKTQLVMDVLGKSAGPKLLPFLNQGKDGIEAFTKEAERMGLVISTDFSDQAGELNDNLDKIAFRITGIWRAIAAEVTPALVDLSAAMLSINEQGTRQASIFGNVLAGGVRLFGGALVGAAEGYDLIVDGTGKLMALGEKGAKAAFEDPFGKQENWKAFGEIWKSTSFIDNYNDALGRTWKVITGLSEAEKEYAENQALYDALFADLPVQTQKNAALAFEAEKKRLAEQQAALEKAKAKALKDAQDLANARKKMLEDVGRLEKSLFTPIQAENDRYQAEHDLLQKALEQNLITRQRFHSLNEAIEGRHQTNLLKIQQDGIDAAFAEWEADFDRRKAAQDAIDAGRKEGKDFVNGIMLEGSDEATKAQAEHDAKMAKLEELRAAEKITEDEYYAAKEEAERQHGLRMLDIKMGTGRAMQDLGNAFNKGMLQGALAFFAADFGGFSAHSRKLFEIQKAAKTANILLNIPETVSTAYKAGMEAGGPFGPAVGTAYATAALAMQLGQLRQIQSQSFGGGSSGATVVGGAPGALPTSSSPTSQADQRDAEAPQVTYVRIPEDAILTGRSILNFVDEALGDGGKLNNLRFVQA